MIAKITGTVIDKGTQTKQDGTTIPYTAIFIPQDGTTYKVKNLDVDLEKFQYKEISVMVNISCYKDNLYVKSY